ncbi:tetratricopeptide repeat protein [Zavarzinia sp. CC-PAN008]|uniref:tetratricopeptide repeat protein n=1 Tax=Zavarzinia sp. CC-PAN008 TaxID=3243332 RepID=UPI003F749C02
MRILSPAPVLLLALVLMPGAMRPVWAATSSEQYDACIAATQDNPAAALATAQALVSRGGGQPAEHCLALAEVATGNPREGAARLERLAEQTGSEMKPAMWAQAGNAWMIAGLYNDAERAFTQSLKLRPNDVDTIVDRAGALAAANDWVLASAALTKAIVLAPGRADLLRLRATAYRRADQPEAAALDIDRALQLAPQDPDALLERGLQRAERGERDSARQDFEAALRLSPEGDAGATAAINLQNLDNPLPLQDGAE